RHRPRRARIAWRGFFVPDATKGRPQPVKRLLRASAGLTAFPHKGGIFLVGAIVQAGWVVRACGGSCWRSWRRRKSWALAATTIVDALMTIAPTAIGRSTPHGTSTPAATGIAMRL